MALLSANYPAVDPERVPYLPWPLTAGLLRKLPTIEFRRHAHTALLAQITAATMGGAKDGKLTDYVLGFAQAGDFSKPGELQLRLPPEEARWFRLALRRGLVSQRMLNYMIA